MAVRSQAAATYAERYSWRARGSDASSHGSEGDAIVAGLKVANQPVRQNTATRRRRHDRGHAPEVFRLSAAALKFLSTPQTGNLPTGFFQNETYGNRGMNYGWGIGTRVLGAPREGMAEMLSPGSYGHGGAWGTQAWIDRSKVSPTS